MLPIELQRQHPVRGVAKGICQQQPVLLSAAGQHGELVLNIGVQPRLASTVAGGRGRRKSEDPVL